MRTLLTVGLLVGSFTVAEAGTYVGLGIGTAPGTSGDTSLDKDGRSGRLTLGFSFGRLAVEGSATKFDLVSNEGTPYGDVSLGLAGKYNVPLADHFEAFGRLGYQRSFLSSGVDYRPSFEGDGVFGGGGFQYRLNLAVAAASIFVDYTISHSSLAAPETYGMQEFGFTSRIWTLGATLSL